MERLIENATTLPTAICSIWLKLNSLIDKKVIFNKHYLLKEM